MFPLKIKIKNIGPYRDLDLDLESLPGTLTAVVGRNGEGKSFLLTSIFAALYRTLPDRPAGIYRYCTARHAGIYRTDFHPPAAAQAQVAETLRKDTLWLKSAAADNADVDTRLFALKSVYPLVFTAANWSRGGQLDETSLQTLLYAYQVCEAVRHGRTVDPTQEQRACSDLLHVFTGWANAAAAPANISA